MTSSGLFAMEQCHRHQLCRAGAWQSLQRRLTSLVRILLILNVGYICPLATISRGIGAFEDS